MLDHRIGNKVAPNLRREDAGGIRVDPYPYIAIVKNNYDPTRSGRLQVWIPDLGGNPEDAMNWRTVSYASPFMGSTSQKQNSKEQASTNNSFNTVAHTYGMWMVPPDIGIEVLVLFVAGDPLRGYWLACVNSGISHYMIPAIAGSAYTADGARGEVAPVAEFNEYNETYFKNPSFYNNPKPIHTYQYNILKVQGLDKDYVRGSISSSSQRESPSQVFGISTPGRPTEDPADSPELAAKYVENLNNKTLENKYQEIKSRKGGHTLVMDDGAILGQDQLIRLRTAKGHQILMQDTENTFYIGHADGTSWVELTSGGAINIYSKGGYNLRSEGTINLHSDADINFNAKGDIKFKSGGKFQIESVKTTLLTASLSVETSGKTEFKVGSALNVETGGGISLVAGSRFVLKSPLILQNSGGEQAVSGVNPIQAIDHSDSSFDGSTWVSKPQMLNSIVTVAPTHEPYPRVVRSSFLTANVGIQPQATYTGSVDATKNQSGTGVGNPALTKDIRQQPPATDTVGNLSKDQMTAYLAQIGKSESSGNYAAVNQLGYVGKYQMGYQALIDGGYIKSSVTSNAQLSNPNSWTGKDGITSQNDFLSNPSVQESQMVNYTQKNYTAMVSNGAVTADMPPEDVGGMLSVSHLLGAGGANSWRKGAGGADANGTTGDTYFNKGKYAVSVLGPQVAPVQAG